MMKAGKILLLRFCLHVFSNAVISAQPQTCPAENVGECGDSDGWEGEFFPAIPTIKYEVPLARFIWHSNITMQRRKFLGRR
ncbi:hypothetical protein K1719_011758 [Acacia pycnantha]|nr:hypothetical protein K1719_011758 [Acacia pycnantha]